MKQIKILVTIIILFNINLGYSQNKEAKKIAKTHKIFAILPPDVSIEPNKKVDSLARKKLEKIESLDFQKTLYSYILKRKETAEIIQEIQSIDSTNFYLNKINYPEKNISNEELCSVLGVDGIVITNLYTDDIMSEAAVIAIAILSPGHGLFRTNSIRGAVNLYDCYNKKMIWNYYHKLSGTVGSDTNSLAKSFLYLIAKKLPYNN